MKQLWRFLRVFAAGSIANSWAMIGGDVPLTRKLLAGAVGGAFVVAYRLAWPEDPTPRGPDGS